MAFSKAVLLVVFAVLLISAEVSPLRDLASTTTPTTDQEGRGGFNRGVIGGNTGGSVSCNRGSKVPCQSSGGNGGNGVPNCKINPSRRECNRYGGKGGNGEKGGRGGHAHGPETEN